MENKIKLLRECNLKIAELLNELEIAYKIEEIKKDFSNAKLYSFKKEFNSATYLIKFLKLEKDLNLTMFLSDYLFTEFMVNAKLINKSNLFLSQGRITNFEKDELKKFKVISVEKIEGD